jgi:hypothetical protein
MSAYCMASSRLSATPLLGPCGARAARRAEGQKGRGSLLRPLRRARLARAAQYPQHGGGQRPHESAVTNAPEYQIS